MNFSRLLSTPVYTSETDRRNFRYVQLDAIGVGLASAAAPFLPVFLARAGATNVQVGLLTAMPAITGLVLSIPLGRYLQRQRDQVPWYSFPRLITILAYGLTGLAAIFLRGPVLIYVVLSIWAVMTLPQTIVSITFNVVMNSVAGPGRRFDLMSRRWSVLGLSTSIAVVLAGQALSAIDFPVNYSIVFLVLSSGGLISYFYSSRIKLEQNDPAEFTGAGIKETIREYLAQFRTEKPFLAFIGKQFVFQIGVGLATPLFPLYYVRVVAASDAWIGVFNTVQTAILIIGYFIWIQQSRLRGSRRILLWTTLGLSIYPVLVALTRQEWLIAVISGGSGIFQAGLNLVFFDELMRTIPPKLSAVFVSFAQSLTYLATIIGPLVGTSLANHIGLNWALMASGAVSLLGFALFWLRESPAGLY